jgi:hypothetical protein
VLVVSCLAVLASEIWYRSLLPDDLPTVAPAPVSASARDVIWIECGGTGPPRLGHRWPPFLLGTFVQIAAQAMEEPHLRDESPGCLIHLAARLLDHRPPRRTPRYLADQLALATWVERNWTAEQTLDFVAANVWMGEGRHGIQAASTAFFGRSVDALELPEVAVLVALARAPSANDPRCHPDRALRARDAVLDRLLEVGRISTSERDTAAATPSSVLGKCPPRAQGRMGHDGALPGREVTP